MKLRSFLKNFSFGETTEDRIAHDFCEKMMDVKFCAKLMDVKTDSRHGDEIAIRIVKAYFEDPRTSKNQKLLKKIKEHLMDHQRDVNWHFAPKGPLEGISRKI